MREQSRRKRTGLRLLALFWSVLLVLASACDVFAVAVP